MKPRIVDAKIVYGGWGETSKVYATLEDGQENVLVFEFYSDEISFSADEFLGLTLDEAYNLKVRKDIAYLRS